MDTPTPDTLPPNPRKPAAFSLGTVLIAAMIIIPGLCFGIAMPLDLGGVTFGLALLWVAALLMFLIAALHQLISAVLSRLRR